MTITEARAKLLAHHPNNTYVVTGAAWANWTTTTPKQERVDYCIAWFLNREGQCKHIGGPNLEILITQVLDILDHSSTPVPVLNAIS